MTEANWSDLFSTIRFVFGQLLQIATVMAVVAGGYFSYRAKVQSDKNGAHLIQQDESLAEVGKKVNGQMTEFAAATKVATDEVAAAIKDHADQKAELLKAHTDETAESLKAEIARLQGKFEAIAGN